MEALSRSGLAADRAWMKILVGVGNPQHAGQYYRDRSTMDCNDVIDEDERLIRGLKPEQLQALLPMNCTLRQVFSSASRPQLLRTKKARGKVNLRSAALKRTRKAATVYLGYRGVSIGRKIERTIKLGRSLAAAVNATAVTRQEPPKSFELRLVTTEAERRAFADTLVQIRSIKGAGFSETKRSHVGDVHLAFGRLYTLYNEAGPNPNEAIAGFVLHDLATFPQSYPKPDLTHLPPEHVFECGELWATTAGGARLARQAAWIMVGLLQAEAMVAYPILKPWNLTIPYVGSFERAGDPIPWPYEQMLDGGKIYVQAMVSEGELLRRSVLEAGQYGFEASEDVSRVRFESPFHVRTPRFD
jgi:hypothetical protein